MELSDLPGGLDLQFYVGRTSTVTLNWPAGSLVGRNFSVNVLWPTGTKTYTVVTSGGNLMTFVVPLADLLAEAQPCAWTLTETTGGGNLITIAGYARITHNLNTTNGPLTVVLNTNQGAVTTTLGLPGATGATGTAGAGFFGPYADAAARDVALPSPVAGSQSYLTTAKQITLYDGGGWVMMSEPIQAWTFPFAGGVTAGNGVFVGHYHRTDGWCDFWGRFTLGTTSAITGAVTFNLPKAQATNSYNQFNGSIFDLSAGLAYKMVSSDAGAIQLLAETAGGTYTTITTLSATVPITFATGDVLAISGRFLMNTRYL